jgi:hypothetical protein
MKSLQKEKLVLKSKNRTCLAGLLTSSLLLLMAPTARAQLQFSGPANYPVETAPFPVAVSDFNGDGKQDLVVLNRGSGTVSVLLGNGDGTFQRALNFAAGSTPMFVAVGDFDGDGKPDLAVAGGSANMVSILMGNGDGTFQLPVQHNTAISADYVAVADFNNDKKADLLVSAAGIISVLLGNGDGTFQAPVVTTNPSTTPYVAIADFNGDGKLDVAMGDAIVSRFTTNGHVIILLGNGDGTFRSPVTSPVSFNPVYLTTRDFNEDGKADLAVVAAFYQVNGLGQICTSEAVSALLGNGDGTFRVSATAYFPHHACTLPPPHNPYANHVAVADLNNDGKLDLVVPLIVPNPSIVAGQQMAIWVFSGNGDGTFQRAQGFNLATLPGWLAVGDFNRDTLPDLMVGNYYANDISVFLNATPSHTLSLIVDGSGGGTVTSRPFVVDCTSSCVGEFAPGTEVTLTAAPNAGSRFTGWSGVCSGTGTCNLTLNANESVTATFSRLSPAFP